MMCKKIHSTFLLFFISFFGVSQGIFNNGANIVLSGAAQIYIDGGANGGYFSQNAGVIHPSATGVVTMEGNWTNNSANTGFFTDNGLVIMNGANQSIGGSSSTTFYNLSLQGSGIKTQNINTSVGGVSTTTGTLNVGAVIYDLNSNILTLTNPATNAITASSGYVLSETNAAANPSILRWNMGTSTGAHVFPFGVAATQIPFTFDKTTAGAANIDVSTRATSASDNAPWASGVSFFYCPNNSFSGNPCAVNSVIDRWWDVTPDAAVTSNITFSYRGIENTLNAPYNSGNIGAQWWDGSGWANDNATISSVLAVSSGVGNVTANSLTQYGPFVLSSSTIPLPVELTDMAVKCTIEGNLINWTTATETNSDYFAIEHSTDAERFTEIYRTKAAGNSRHQIKYSFTHSPSNDAEVNYYRIIQTDRDQNFKKFKVLSSQNCQTKTNHVQVNNTINGEVFILFNNAVASPYSIKVYDLLGKLITEENITAPKGTLNMPLHVSQALSGSLYILQVNGNTVQKSQKIILNPEP